MAEIAAIILAILQVMQWISTRIDKKRDNTEELKKIIKKLSIKIDENRRKDLRSRLVNEYTDLINGQTKTKEQMQDIEDDYEEYTTELHGNTYVHDLHKIWINNL